MSSATGKNRDTGKHKTVIRAEHQAWADEQPTITRCGLCGWSYEGTASFGRHAAQAHREEAHPEIKPKRRRRGSLQRFGVTDTHFQTEGRANGAKVAAALARLEDVA